MGFTTAAFIRRNTSELRKKLERLGYYLHPECIDDDRGNYLFVNREYYLNRPLGYSEELSRSIDCGTNESLFLALASLRNDSDIHQWFTDGEKWVISDIHSLLELKEYFQLIKFDYSKTHKATAEELIKHFNS